MQSLSLLQLLKYIKKDFVRKEYHRPYQLLVNDRENIKCVLFISSMTGFQCDYESLTEEEKFRKRRVAFFCDENDDQLLMKLIERHLPWSKINYFIFASIPARFSTLIHDFVRNNHLGQCEIHSFLQMELDKATFENKRENIIISSHLAGNNHSIKINKARFYTCRH